MAAAIDERTPYNANHSRNVSNYILDFVKYYNEQYKLGYVEEYFDEVRLEQLHLAALLHDIGKVAIPLDVMNKSTRLGKKLKDILSRFELFRCYYKIDFLEHKLRQEEYDALVTQLNQIQEFILRINSATYLNDTDYNTLQQYKHLAYCVKNRKKLPYLTPEEFECLSIRTGTLTAKEREIMESHVVITERLLKRFKFQKQYANIPRWANSHHEFLDGSGYPKHLTGKDMPLEIRILCIADIYDALTATDRPYKSPMSQEKALSILYDMSEEGKLDRNLVLIFSDMLKDAQP